MKKRLLFFPVALLGVLLWLSSCATAPAPKPGPARTGDRFSGSYVGLWLSEGGHHGRLKCEFTRQDATHYQAHFTAWWSVFHTSYDTVFETKEEAGVLYFQGAHDLGALRGGLYHYRGQIAGRKWQARYFAPSDRGTFTLERW